MPLYTTYLAKRNQLVGSPSLLQSAFPNKLPIQFLFVYSKRGNWQVEPPKMLLDLHLPMLKCKKDFEKSLGEPLSSTNVHLAVVMPDVIPTNLFRTFADWVYSNPNGNLEEILWKGYQDAYLDSLATQESRIWMQKVAAKTLDENVVLVCYEKSAEHCHRRLLAELMAHDYGCEYLGELS